MFRILSAIFVAALAPVFATGSLAQGSFRAVRSAWWWASRPAAAPTSPHASSPGSSRKISASSPGREPPRCRRQYRRRGRVQGQSGRAHHPACRAGLAGGGAAPDLEPALRPAARFRADHHGGRVRQRAGRAPVGSRAQPREYVKLANAKPGTMTYGTSGIGGAGTSPASCSGWSPRPTSRTCLTRRRPQWPTCWAGRSPRCSPRRPRPCRT